MPSTAREHLPALARLLVVTLGCVLLSEALAAAMLWAAGWPARATAPQIHRALVVMAASGGIAAVATLFFALFRLLGNLPSAAVPTVPPTVRTVLLFVPWLVAMLIDERVVTAPAAAFRWALPVACALGAAGIATTIPTGALLATGTHPVRDDADAVYDPPRPLSSRLAHDLLFAALAACLVSATFVYPRVEDPTFPEGPLWLPPAAMAVVSIVLAGISARALGRSLRVDLDTIATRLDALGYNVTVTAPWRIAPTSLDDVGALEQRLDRLRVRLEKDAASYQEALERARDADLAKVNFLSAVSHEIRTPLTTVDGFAQILLERPLAPAQADDVRLIRAGAQQLLELVTDTLDISLIESGELRLEFDRTDVTEIAAQVVEVHQSLLRDKPVRMDLEIGPDVPPVVCDRRRVRQILTNLVSNAIKFTDEGAIVVEVRHAADRGAVVLRVSDTGVGIAPEEIEHIFEEYKQVGPVKRRSKGTGLGLAIARRIAEHHGGSLRCTSEPGRGSTFTLTLPLDPGHRRTRIEMSPSDGVQALGARRPGPGPGKERA